LELLSIYSVRYIYCDIQDIVFYSVLEKFLDLNKMCREKSYRNWKYKHRTPVSLFAMHAYK